MYKYIKQFYGGHKAHVTLFLFLTFMLSGLWMLSPFILGKMMDMMAARQSIWHIVAIVSILPLLSFTRSFIRVIRKRINRNMIWFPIQEKLRMQTIDRYLSFSIGQLRSMSSGMSREVIVSGEHSLQTFTATIVSEVLPVLARVIATIGMLLYFSLYIGLIAILGLTIYGFVVKHMKQKFNVRIKETRDKALVSSKQRGDLLAGATIIKAYSKEAESRDTYRDRYYLDHVESAKRNDDYVMTRSRAMYAILTLTEYASILACIYLWSQNTMTVGTLTTIRIWLVQIFDDIEALGDKYQTLLVEAASAERFLQLISITPAIRNTEDPVRLDELAGTIEFKHVSFSYKKKDGSHGKKVLKDISFYARPNERIAIVGKSGSGKSTLITLLQRGYEPDSGSIEVDGNNLRLLDLVSYHKNLAVVDQNFLTLERTIAENVCLGAPKPLSEEEILHFCSLVDLNVDNFENGIHTMIGELGSGVSGGERQRIAIARALASEAKILVFDEPTSSLDAMTEASIKRALDEASKTRTTITIAHRLSTIQDSDRILVVDEGRIVAIGNHDELCKNCPLYITFVKEQLVRF